MQAQQLRAAQGLDEPRAVSLPPAALRGATLGPEGVEEGQNHDENAGTDDEQILGAQTRDDGAREGAAGGGTDDAGRADQPEEAPARAGVEDGIGHQPHE